ncbi:MAG TPA: Sip1-related alpha-galactosidase [Chthoniobacterales bacterium]
MTAGKAKTERSTSNAPSYEITDGTLRIAGAPVLEGLAPSWSVVEDTTGSGVFLRSEATDAACFLELPLGRLSGMIRFTSCHRFSPFWTKPANGTTDAEVQPETLWLLALSDTGRCTLVVPLLDATTRYSLRGTVGGLAVVAETGDPAVTSDGGVVLYVSSGGDPYALAAAGARAVQRHLGTGVLRVDKPVPDFVDLFGWCTWDAFYKEVSADKVLAGLKAFASGGVQPPLLILDDGWQTWVKAATGEERLMSLAPNERFGGDLTALVRETKERFRVQRFLVWHALLGYWGGLDEQSLPDYGTRTVARAFGPGLLEQESRWNTGPWGAQVGVPSAEKIGTFYDDYHRQLAAQGVDGVKVDVQAMLEGVSAGQGGRMALAIAYRRALETSVTQHFGGRLINCMSSTSECAYLAADSTLMRTSDDFFPQRPESHGLHLHTNALAGMWFGEFMQPDWDMFQSTHERGSFHAAARAVSGGPVYVSDKVGAHDFELLRKVVLSDGTVLRADYPGRPTLDCLYADPTREPVLLKIFNLNDDCGVIGLFNARYGAPAGERVSGAVAASNVPLLRRGNYAALAHRSGNVWPCAFDDRTPIDLAEGEWELVSFAPVENGFAALGLADKFNSTRAISSRMWQQGECHLSFRDGGSFVAWAAHKPSTVLCDDHPIAFSYDQAGGQLAVTVPAGHPHSLVIRWP